MSVCRQFDSEAINSTLTCKYYCLQLTDGPSRFSAQDNEGQSHGGQFLKIFFLPIVTPKLENLCISSTQPEVKGLKFKVTEVVCKKLLYIHFTHSYLLWRDCCLRLLYPFIFMSGGEWEGHRDHLLKFLSNFTPLYQYSQLVELLPGTCRHWIK